MSSAGINFSGLASGLDTDRIISALLAVERQPILALEQKKSVLKQTKSKFGELDELLDTLRDKADALKSTKSFLEFKADVDTEDFLTATASSSATAGSHDIRVEALARAQVYTSTGKADKDTTQYGASTLRMDIDGSSFFVSIDSADSTLQGIANRINDEASNQGFGVRAEVIDTGNSTDPYQIVLRSTEPGSDNAFTLSMDSGTSSMQNLVDDINTSTSTKNIEASDAHIELDGIDVYRSSNTLTDVIPGVTINLKGENDPNNSGESTTLTVSTDTEKTSEKVKEFIDAYNEIVDFVEATNALDEEGNAKSPLFGDSTLRSIRSNLRSIVGSVVDTGNEAYSMFAQIGVESDTNGRLTFNQSGFDQALGDDEAAVRALFTDATAGIAGRIYDDIDLYTDSVDGLLKSRTDGLDSLIKQTNDNIRRKEDRLEAYELQLTNKFANLENMMSQLQAQGNALSGGLQL